MLRITQQTSSAAAKTYFSSADYFTEGQELEGRWYGKGADRLGLSGIVRQKNWDALCDNLDPRTGLQLTARKNAQRRIGWDCTFSVPKSVSLLYALTNDQRIVDAFNDAVDQTMTDIESELHTRVRAKGQNMDRATGNGVWGRFTHFTSRPVDGVPDPHLHSHCFLFNSTFDEAENLWKAVQIHDIKRDANYFNAVMHSRLAHRLVSLGVPIERTVKAWRVTGLDETTESKFSRRRNEIDALAHERGISDPEEKAALGAQTRQHKNKQLSMGELRAIWLSWLTPDESHAIQQAERSMGSAQAPVTDHDAPRAALDHAAEHHFERDSVIPERTLLTTALHHAIGKALPKDILQEHPTKGLIVAEQNGRKMVTSPAVLREESQMIAFARNGRNAYPELAPDDVFPSRDWLNEGQRKALAHLCSGRDRVMLMRGAAGAGKTSLLSEAVEKIQKHGKQVFVFAPSTQASRDVLRSEGFSNAETVSYLLANPEAQAAIQNQVILIDEAGLLGTRTMAKLFDLAQRQNARVILSGDRYQHASVERGSALRLLEEEAGIRSAELTDIVRQKDRYKEAVTYLSQGRVEAGFNALDDLKWIHEIDDPKRRYEQLAAEYLQATEAGKSVLVVSPTHAEGRQVTAAVRSALRHEGKIGVEEHLLPKLTSKKLTVAQRRDPVNYTDGDVVVYTQNARGHRKGERLLVGRDPIPLEQAARFEVYQRGTIGLTRGDKIRITANAMTADGHRVSNGQVYSIKQIADDGTLTLNNGWQLDSAWGQIDYGYCNTSYASQGMTKDIVIVAMSSESFPAINRQTLYVAASRGKQSASIYCDDREGLLDAAMDGDERLSATELTGTRSAQLERYRRYEQFQGQNIPIAHASEREGMTHGH